MGKKLFPDFENPLAAKSLEVVTFNEDNATIRDFKVAQTKGVWSIPSHSNYPADAKEHMAKAATALMDLKVLSVASDRPGDQKTYGVITPDPEELKVGMTGVGTRVTVRDGEDKVLADLVIGKTVKDRRTCATCAKPTATGSTPWPSRPTSSRPSSATGSKRICSS